MKLTKFGIDYSIAILLLAGLGGLAKETLFAVLGLGLAFAYLASIALMLARGKRVSARASHIDSVRVFKGEKARIELEVPSLAGSWDSTELASARLGAPAEVRATSEAGKVVLEVTPRVAGRFEKAILTIRTKDLLKLASRRDTEVEVALRLDSLPLSLLSPIRRPFISPLAAGERPGGSPGKGQEFYAIEEYKLGHESKDILWGRAAKSPDLPLMARVRESSIPEALKIAIVHGEFAQEDRAVCMDLQCEALGPVARAVLMAGAKAVIVGPGPEERTVMDEEELVESIMEASASYPVVGRSEIGDADIILLVGEVGGLAIPGRAQVVRIGAGTPPRELEGVAFTGDEALVGLVDQVLAK